jgi:hypothetical protein
MKVDYTVYFYVILFVLDIPILQQEVHCLVIINTKLTTLSIQSKPMRYFLPDADKGQTAGACYLVELFVISFITLRKEWLCIYFK